MLRLDVRGITIIFSFNAIGYVLTTQAVFKINFTLLPFRSANA